MTTEMREYRLEISEDLSKISQMCQRIFEARTRREPSLSNVIQYRMRSVNKILNRVTSTLCEHLAVIPTAGDVAINLALPVATDDLLAQARTRFSAKLKMDLSLGDTISILLFDYVVEDKADIIFARLGLDTLQ